MIRRLLQRLDEIVSVFWVYAPQGTLPDTLHRGRQNSSNAIHQYELTSTDLSCKETKDSSGEEYLLKLSIFFNLSISSIMSEALSQSDLVFFRYLSSRPKYIHRPS